jgi:aminopeptidase-like protein
MSEENSKIHGIIDALFPICRSITGNGVRQSLEIIREHIPLQVREVPSGTQVLDWTVPKEWNINDAYVADLDGKRIIDFRKHNLHVLNYSVPIHARMSLAELRPHLFSLPDQPNLIPYRTSYYNENWGFCLSHNALEAIPEGDYDVVIDSSLSQGSLTYGELVLPGERQDEFLISTHICHPSLANDNLTGIALATALAARIAQRERRRHTYRFLFVPGAIGSITWLASNENIVDRIKHGLVVTGVGDTGALTYKKSRQGNAHIDRIAAHVLAHWTRPGTIAEFEPYGYDERQYCSPGFNLPVGRVSRTPFGTFPEYHTSADNLSFIQVAQIEDALNAIEAMIDIVERDASYLNLYPKGEPQLGRRGIYRQIAGQADRQSKEKDLFWTLSYSDGSHSLLDIAARAGRPFQEILSAAQTLEGVGILEKTDDAATSRTKHNARLHGEPDK